MRHLSRRSSHVWRVLPLLAALIVLALVAAPGLTPASQAEGAPFSYLPGYGPLEGCVDVAVASVGMFPNGEGTLSVDVPGPVLDAWLVWTGTNDTVPADPMVSEITVNGTPVTGNAYDMLLPISIRLEWYSYLANLGPAGLNLVSQGSNTLNLAGWDPVPGPVPVNRNGATLFVAYDTTPCSRANAIYVLDNIDWAFWRDPRLEFATNVIPFTFPSTDADRTGRLYTSIAGIDHMQRDHLQCRGIRMWFEQGAGAVPAALYQQAWPESIGVNGGFAIADDIWNPTPPCTPEFRAPATSLTGGYSEGGGDYGQAVLAVTVPAGVSHVAYQLESERPADPNITPLFGGGESFAWIGPGSPFVIDIPSPDLTVSKSDGLTTANPGDTLTYTINFSNLGDGAAADVVIQDTLPDYVTFVSASDGGTEAGGVVTWNLGALAPGASGSVSVTVQVDALFPAAGTYTLTNAVTISTPTPGDDPSNNSGSDTTTVDAAPELALTKAAAPNPVPAGDQVTYTIDWSVSGSAPAVNLTLTDAVPADTTFVSASDGGTEAGGVVTWNLGTQNPGASGSVTLIVQTAVPLENGLVINNTALLSESGPLALSESASAAVTIVSSHTIDVNKTAEPDPVDAGGLLTYTITYAATGNSPTGNVTLTDAVPANTTFISASDGGTEAGGVVTWDLGDLLPRASGVTSASGSVTMVVQVDTPLVNGLVLENSAVLDDEDPDVPPITSTITTTVQSDHILTLTKTASPSPVAKGAELTYTLTWGVEGNEPAPNVVLQDIIPFGTTFVSASDGGVFSAPFVTWNLGNQNPPASGVVTFVVRVHPTLPNGIDIVNSAVLSDDDPGTPPVTASVTTPVIPTAFGSIGDDVFVDLDNDGVRDPGEPGLPGVGVTLSQPGPDGVCGTADDVAVASTVTNGDGKYLFPNLLPGDYCVTVNSADIPAGLTLGGSFSNPLAVTVGENEDVRDADFGYIPAAGAALIGDTVWLDADGDGVQDPGEMGIGGVTVLLKEPGPDGLCGTADDVTVSSTVTTASGFYQFAVQPGTYCVMVDETTLPAGVNVLTGGTNPHGPITVNAGDNYDTADFGYSNGPFGSIGNLVFFDANRDGVYQPGSEGGIANVTLDLFGAGADGVCGTGDDVFVGSTTTDSTGAYLFTGLMDGTYCVVVSDTNGVLSDYVQTFGAPDTDNNGQVSPYTVVISGANTVLHADFGFADGHILSLLKSDSPDPVDAGGLLIYSITYSVFGREPAPNVVLRDTLPAHTTFVSATNGGTESGGVVTWNLGTLAPGTTGTVQITVQVDSPLVHGTVLRNWITLSDDDGLTVEDIEDTRVRSRVLLTITKTDAPDPVLAGQELVFTLAYEATGNAPATDVTITDAVPAGTTFVSATGGGTESGGVVTWNLGTLLPPASGSVQMTVLVDATLTTGTIIHNTAVISGRGGDTPPGDEDSSTTEVIGIPVLQLRKSASTAGPVIFGDVFTYELCYQNVGGGDATDTTLVDTLPANLDYVAGSATAGGVYDSGAHTLSWNLGTLAPSAETCVSFDVKVARTDPALLSATGQVIPYRVWADLLLHNVAVLDASNHDPVTAEHDLTLSAIVNPGIFKAVDKTNVLPGEAVEFTLSVTNDGNAPATNVIVTDQLNTLLENVTVSTSQGTASYDAATNTVTVDLGTINPGATATITIMANVKDLDPAVISLPLTFPNSAVLAYGEGDPRESNVVHVTVDEPPPPPFVIPEPGTIFLLGSGLAGLAGWARRRRQQQG